MVPRAEAILASIPLTSRAAPEALAARSSVSMAKILADMESPTNRMPSGPKAKGPADLRSALPVVMGAANAKAARATNTVNRKKVEVFMAQVSFRVKTEPSIRDITIEGGMQCHVEQAF